MTTADLSTQTNASTAAHGSGPLEKVLKFASAPVESVKSFKAAIGNWYTTRQRRRELDDFCGKLDRLTDQQLEILGFYRGSLPFALEDLHKKYHRKRDQIEREFG